jgi:hypothetical protein
MTTAVWGKAEKLPGGHQSTKSSWYEVTINILGVAGVATDHAGCSLSFHSPPDVDRAEARARTANVLPQKKAVVSVLRGNHMLARTDL